MMPPVSYMEHKTRECASMRMGHAVPVGAVVRCADR